MGESLLTKIDTDTIKNDISTHEFSQAVDKGFFDNAVNLQQLGKELQDNTIDFIESSFAKELCISFQVALESEMKALQAFSAQNSSMLFTSQVKLNQEEFLAQQKNHKNNEKIIALAEKLGLTQDINGNLQSNNQIFLEQIPLSKQLFFERKDKQNNQQKKKNQIEWNNKAQVVGSGEWFIQFESHTIFKNGTYEQKKKYLVDTGLKIDNSTIKNKDEVKIKCLLKMIKTPKGDLTLFGVKDWAEKQKAGIDSYNQKLRNDLGALHGSPNWSKVLENRNKAKYVNKQGPRILDSRKEVTDLDNQEIKVRAEQERMHFVIEYFDAIIKLPDKTQGFLKDFGNGRDWQIPFASGLEDIIGNINILTAVQRKQKNDPADPMTPADEYILNAFTALDRGRKEVGKMNLTGYDVGAGGSGTLNFLLELGMTGGLIGLGRKVAVEGVKKGTKNVVTGLIKKETRGATAKSIANGGKEIAKTGALMTTTIQSHNTVNNILKELIPKYDLKLDAQGHINLEEFKAGKSLINGIIKGVFKSFVSNSAEQLGGPVMNELSSYLPKGVIDNLLIKVLTSGKGEKVLQDGFVGESLEEFMSQGLEGIVNRSRGDQKLTDIYSLHGAKVTILVCLLVSGGMNVVSIGESGINYEGDEGQTHHIEVNDKTDATIVPQPLEKTKEKTAEESDKAVNEPRFKSVEAYEAAGYNITEVKKVGECSVKSVTKGSEKFDILVQHGKILFETKVNGRISQEGAENHVILVERKGEKIVYTVLDYSVPGTKIVIQNMSDNLSDKAIVYKKPGYYSLNSSADNGSNAIYSSTGEKINPTGSRLSEDTFINVGGKPVALFKCTDANGQISMGLRDGEKQLISADVCKEIHFVGESMILDMKDGSQYWCDTTRNPWGILDTTRDNTSGDRPNLPFVNLTTGVMKKYDSSLLIQDGKVIHTGEGTNIDTFSYEKAPTFGTVEEYINAGYTVREGKQMGHLTSKILTGPNKIELIVHYGKVLLETSGKVLDICADHHAIVREQKDGTYMFTVIDVVTRGNVIQESGDANTSLEYKNPGYYFFEGPDGKNLYAPNGELLNPPLSKAIDARNMVTQFGGKPLVMMTFHDAEKNISIGLWNGKEQIIRADLCKGINMIGTSIILDMKNGSQYWCDTSKNPWGILDTSMNPATGVRTNLPFVNLTTGEIRKVDEKLFIENGTVQGG